jgi:hypothetical protein
VNLEALECSCLLSICVLQQTKKKLKEISVKFDEEDLISGDRVSKEQVERRRAQWAEWQGAQRCFCCLAPRASVSAPLLTAFRFLVAYRVSLHVGLGALLRGITSWNVCFAHPAAYKKRKEDDYRSREAQRRALHEGRLSDEEDIVEQDEEIEVLVKEEIVVIE